MHIKIVTGGLLIVSGFQLGAMGADQRPPRVVLHAKRFADTMRDATRVTQVPAAPVVQAPAPVAQQPQEGQIQRANAQFFGSTTVPAPTINPAGTVIGFMQHNLQDRTAVAMSQLAIQEQAVFPMDDIEYTPSTPVIDQREPEHAAEAPVTRTEGLVAGFVAASDDAFAGLTAALAATRSAHSSSSASSRSAVAHR